MEYMITGHIRCGGLVYLFFYDFSEGIPLYGRYLNVSDGNIPPPLLKEDYSQGDKPIQQKSEYSSEGKIPWYFTILSRP